MSWTKMTAAHIAKKAVINRGCIIGGWGGEVGGEGQERGVDLRENVVSRRRSDRTACTHLFTESLDLYLPLKPSSSSPTASRNF